MTAAVAQPTVSRALPITALLAAITSIQFGATFAKGLFPVLGPEGTTAARLAVGGLMLTAILRPWRIAIPRRVWPWLLAYGVTLAVMNLLFYAALKTIPLGVAVALEFSGPLLVASLSSRRPLDLLWVTLALAGIILLSPLVQASIKLDPWGVAFALAAGGCWALYIVFAQKVGASLGSQATAIGMMIAAVVALPFGVAQASPALVEVSLLGSVLAVGLFSSALPFWLEMVALTRMPARVYGTITCIEPAVGALLGFALLGETLSVVQCGGIAAVVLAASGAALTMKPIAGPNEPTPP